MWLRQDCRTVSAPHALPALRHVKPAAVTPSGVVLRDEGRGVGPRVLEIGVDGQPMALALPIAWNLNLRGTSQFKAE